MTNQMRACLVAAATALGCQADAHLPHAGPQDADGVTALVQLQGQGWTRDTRERFYFADQGSMLIPYDFFLALETADGRRFRSDENLLQYGFQPYGEARTQLGRILNPDRLPIGLVKHVERADAKRWGQNTSDWLGETCASCHTQRMTLARAGQPVRVEIDGASFTNQSRFRADLRRAVQETLADPARLARFESVVGQRRGGAWRVPGAVAGALAAYVQNSTGLITLTFPGNGAPDWGYGRMDAFGQILNEVSYLIAPQSPASPVDAPVSMPAVWGSPRFEFVETNGSAGSPLIRNVGEALGQWADFGFNPPGTAPLFRASVHYGTVDGQDDGVLWLERALRSLKAPAWSELARRGLLPPVDPVRARAGKAVYAANCAMCHVVPGTAEATVTRQRSLQNLQGTGTQTFTRTFGKIFVAPPERLLPANRVLEAGGKACTGTCKDRPETRNGDVYLLRTISGPDGKPVAVRVGDASSLTQDSAGTDLQFLTHLARRTTTLSASDPRQAALLSGYRANPSLPPGTVASDGTLPTALLLATAAGQLALQPYLDQGARLTPSGTLDFTAVPDRYQNFVEDQNATDPDHASPLSPPLGYYARDLAGIWATAPYLHNGSVANLVELLTPPAQRAKQFYVGSNVFDPARIGFSTEPTPVATLLDTAVPGNSNAGHAYGTELSAAEKERLIEYIKTLTSDGEDPNVSEASPQ
jgi:hypothetical protein